jgi:hypothetical protein
MGKEHGRHLVSVGQLSISNTLEVKSIRAFLALIILP